MNPKINYYDNGNKYYEAYFVNGKLHRLDGPAWIEYHADGSIFYEEYFIDGNKIPQNEIDEILKECNSDKQLFIDILTIRYM